METLYWIFPCYNEEACFEASAEQILSHFRSYVEEGLIAPESKVVFVNDGSKDRTWPLIDNLAKSEKEVIGVCLSRNKGHQYAVEAGLRYAYEKGADFTITMDVDLQDDITVVKAMIEEHLKGFDVVYGVRNDRATDSFFKRFTANSYYKLLRRFGVEMIENSADFRLISHRALGALLEFHEANLFLRGLVPQVGYPSSKVEYKRLERQQGETHYPLGRMVTLAVDGITAFSIKPLGMIGRVGFALCFLSAVAMIVFGILHGVNVLPYSIFYYLFPFISFMTGILCIGMGVLGLYLGRINLETRKRPHYFIQEISGE